MADGSPSYVYAIQSIEGGLVKIGRSVDVVARMRTLQCASPTQLKLLAHWTGESTEERALHSHFGTRPCHGEWFDFGSDDPVAAVSKALGRWPEAPLSTESRRAAEVREADEALAKLGAEAVAEIGESLAARHEVYRLPGGQVVSEWECTKTCYGSSTAWGPGHMHSVQMSAEQYEKHGAAGPLRRIRPTA